MAIFSDTLESYSVGQNPFGSWLDIGFFKGQINTNTFNRNEGSRIYQMGLNGQILFQNLGQLSGTGVVYWVGCNTPNFIISQTTLTGTGSVGQMFGFFQVENDRTISLYAVNTLTGNNTPFLIGNSTTAVQHQDTWQDYQVLFACSTAISIIGTNTRTTLQVTGTCWVEGTMVVNGGTVTTNLDMSGLPQPNGTNFNNWQFSASGPVNNGGFLDNLWGIASGIGTATFPFADTTKARVTQGVVENIRRGSPAARVTQGAVEQIRLPNPNVRKARITQGVIEIIKRGASGWVVYEA